MNAQYIADLRSMPRLPKGSSVLVAGASGLIGSFLVDALVSQEVEVTAMGRNEKRLSERFDEKPNLRLLAQDVSKKLPGEMKFDYIIHAASLAHPLAFSMDPIGTMKANVVGTLSLLEHIHSQGMGRLLMLSTGEVYGENTTGEDFREADMGILDSANPRSCSPESKRAAETLCASFHQQHGTDTLIARICYVFGPGITDESSRADAQFLRNAINGQDIVMKSEGTQIRSYLYVADCARALLKLLLSGKAGEAYNVAAPEGKFSIREYAQTLADAAGVKLCFELPTEAERAGYSKQTRATLNADKLIALGFKPCYTLQDGIRQMVEIAKDRGA